MFKNCMRTQKKFYKILLLPTLCGQKTALLWVKSLSCLERVPQAPAIMLPFAVVNKNKVFPGKRSTGGRCLIYQHRKVAGKSRHRAVLSCSEEPSFLSELNACKGQRTGQTTLAMSARVSSMQEKIQQGRKARTAQVSKDRTAVLAAFGRQTQQARGQGAVLSVEEHCLSHRITSTSLPYRGASTTLHKQL